MIRCADIGIGINGLEGSAAARVTFLFFLDFIFRQVIMLLANLAFFTP